MPRESIFACERWRRLGLLPLDVPGHTQKTLVTAILATVLGSEASAQELDWKGSFLGCSGSSPFIEALISKTDPDHRPLMRIENLQVWSIRQKDGTLATAMTTPGGLTIIGQILGPQGEDLSSALLATSPDLTALPALGAQQIEASKGDKQASSVPSADIAPQIQPMPSPRDPEPGFSTVTQIDTLQLATNTPTSVPITANAQPSESIQAGMDEMFRQASAERIWFSAGNAKPDAPVVYMLADPECPHCQWTIDRMRNQIVDG